MASKHYKKLDPEVQALTEKLHKMEPLILARHTFNRGDSDNADSQIRSLNAKIGGKCEQYCKIKFVPYETADEFITAWFLGLMDAVMKNSIEGKSERAESIFCWQIQHDSILCEYTQTFLRRAYLLKHKEYARIKPSEDDCIIWMGDNNSMYGLYICPEYRNNSWRVDRSEVRHFKPGYWTIGHVMETGLIVSDSSEPIRFDTVAIFLNFYIEKLVEPTHSPYGLEIAEMYRQFVLQSTSPNNIPLLIPEYRYGGVEKAHRYRLDFLIINPITLQKVGFELSPWSTHGRLHGAENKTCEMIDGFAKRSFEETMEKERAFFQNHHIPVQTFTDTDLHNMTAVFDVMKKYLSPVKWESACSLQDTICKLHNFKI